LLSLSAKYFIEKQKYFATWNNCAGKSERQTTHWSQIMKRVLVDLEQTTLSGYKDLHPYISSIAAFHNITTTQNYNKRTIG
jgi:hypothetical protein